MKHLLSRIALTALHLLFANAYTSVAKLPPLPLPQDVTAAYVDCVNSTGLVFHALSAGCDKSNKKPLVLLVHGFPEVAYTWTQVMPALASEGYCVVAPDLRGAGRTTGWDTRPFSQTSIAEFSNTNMVRDLVALVYGWGYTEVASIVGHDYGAIIAAWAALIRPDMFKSSVHLTNPFDLAKLPAYPAPVYHQSTPTSLTVTQSSLLRLEADLEKLDPPRKYYQLSNSQESAANDWNTGGTLGQRDFLRGYFYLKSADWPGNHPHALTSNTAEQLAQIPHYYVMLLNETMSETVASLTAGEDVTASHKWLPQKDLDIYLQEFQRVGFQGELNWYRSLTGPLFDGFLMAGRKIEVPVIFIGGNKDWGTYQHPGAFEAYNTTCTDFWGAYFISGAGHWIQLEQPQALTKRIVKFLQEVK